MTLLDKAHSHLPFQRPLHFSAEELEVCLAWLAGNVSIGQVCVALLGEESKLKTTQGYQKMAHMARELVRSGRLVEREK